VRRPFALRTRASGGARAAVRRVHSRAPLAGRFPEGRGGVRSGSRRAAPPRRRCGPSGHWRETENCKPASDAPRALHVDRGRPDRRDGACCGGAMVGHTGARREERAGDPRDRAAGCRSAGSSGARSGFAAPCSEPGDRRSGRPGQSASRAVARDRASGGRGGRSSIVNRLRCRVPP
jgi:hypothetical protein